MSGAVLEAFAADSVLAPFLEATFDSREFTSQSLDHQDTAEKVVKLQEGVARLQDEINTQVRSLLLSVGLLTLLRL